MGYLINTNQQGKFPAAEANPAASLRRYCLYCIRVLAYFFLAAFPMLPASAAAPELGTQFDFSSETTPGAGKFYFETIPATATNCGVPSICWSGCPLLVIRRRLPGFRLSTLLLRA